MSRFAPLYWEVRRKKVPHIGFGGALLRKRNAAVFVPVLLPVFLAMGLLATSSRLFAHHGFGVAFEMANPITQMGTVKELVWTNPHVQLYYDVKGGNGKVVTWIAELTNPRALVRMGFTKDVVKPGDNITITVNPAKSKAPRGLIVRMLRGDTLVYDDKNAVDTLFQ